MGVFPNLEIECIHNALLRNEDATQWKVFRVRKIVEKLFKLQVIKALNDIMTATDAVGCRVNGRIGCSGCDPMIILIRISGPSPAPIYLSCLIIQFNQSHNFTKDI